MFHYDGVSWGTMTTGVSTGLVSIWGSSDHDAFGVGNGALVHYDGVSWTPVALPGGQPTPLLRCVLGSSARDVWAVGGTLTLHYDRSSWTSIPINTVNGLSAVWGRSPSDVLTVGGFGRVEHYGPM